MNYSYRLIAIIFHKEYFIQFTIPKQISRQRKCYFDAILPREHVRKKCSPCIYTTYNIIDKPMSFEKKYKTQDEELLLIINNKLYNMNISRICKRTT